MGQGAAQKVDMMPPTNDERRKFRRKAWVGSNRPKGGRRQPVIRYGYGKSRSIGAIGQIATGPVSPDP
jgi:hypothetical protein